MDAVEFFKTAKRLCKNQGCDGCPVCKNNTCMVMLIARLYGASDESIEETILKVEQWAKDHPAKTRQSELLKIFPNADLTRLLPCHVEKDKRPMRCAEYGYLSITCRCDRCRDDYWKEEVSDNE